jgi:hypothetical protein
LTRHLGGYPTVYGLVPLFNLNGEQNVPTYFNASLHLVSSMLLAIIAVLKTAARDRFSRQWTVLCAGFLFMAFDEAAGLHELMERPMRELLGGSASGYLHFAWVIPGALIALFFAVWFLRFILHLPPSTRSGVLLAGVLFVGGAVGVEVFEGHHAALHGSDNLIFDAYVLLEETLEMAGLTVFISALLGYMEMRYGEIALRLRAAPAHESPRMERTLSRAA